MTVPAAPTPRSRAAHPRVKAAVDLALLAWFAVLFLTREGPIYTLHSIIGLLLLVPIVVHLLSKRSWISRAWSRSGWASKRPNSRLNLTLGLTTAACIVTGVPAWIGYSSWAMPHTVTGFASVLLALTHLIRNRRKLRGVLRAARRNTPNQAAQAAPNEA
jgi:hypothetical protein